MSKRGVGARPIARPWLRALAPVYGAVTGLKRRLVGWGLLKRRWLKDPVISVGSCSAGGAGKTPVVLLLEKILSRRGYAVRILTRGYGRESTAVERVDAAGNAFPSLHVATAVFASIRLHALLSRIGFSAWVRGISAIWALAIVFSTIATKQHVAVDVAGGTALACGFAFLSKWIPPDRIGGRRRPGEFP